LVRKAKQRTADVIEQLKGIRAANPGRPLCGILLIEHIGDIIACEPVIAQVRASHPNALLLWGVKPAYASLVRSHPGLDAVVCVDSLLGVERIVQSHVFDIIVDLHVNSKATEVAGRFYRKRAGDRTVDVANYVGVGSLLQSFSKAAGIEPRSEQPAMYLPKDVVAAVDRHSLPEHFVVVHAHSNYSPKDWPPEKWRDLVRFILEHYETSVIEIGLESKIELDHARFIRLCGKLSITETAELIRRADFFIGIDSGPAHMANASRRPALLLFGRYAGSDTFNPFEGHFRDAEATVIFRYAGPLREQRVRTVIQALEASPMWNEALGKHRRSGASTIPPISQ
jgi:heptosyltransferase-3